MAVVTATVTSSGELVPDGCKVYSVYVRSTGTAGTVELKDGGSGGTTRVNIPTPAVAEAQPVPLAGGVLFDTDCYAALTNVDGCMVVYEDFDV
jgi:hypothetical protein